MLTVVGSLALVMFVVGGFFYLTSAGNQERVKRGTQTMLWAAIGIAVVFSSYTILNTLILGLTGGASGGGGAGGGNGGGPPVQTYYTVGAADVQVRKTPADTAVAVGVLRQTSPCVPGTGNEENGWIEVNGAVDKDTSQKIAGWIEGTKLTPMTKAEAATCTGAGTLQTACEVQHASTHTCQDTTTFPKGVDKNTDICQSGLCQNSILSQQGITNPNDWMCCRVAPDHKAQDKSACITDTCYARLYESSNNTVIYRDKKGKTVKVNGSTKQSVYAGTCLKALETTTIGSSEYFRTVVQGKDVWVRVNSGSKKYWEQTTDTTFESLCPVGISSL